MALPSWLVMLKKEDYYPNLARVLFKLAVRKHTELDIHIGFIDALVALACMSQTRIEPDVLAIGQGVSAPLKGPGSTAGMGDVPFTPSLDAGFWVPLVR